MIGRTNLLRVAVLTAVGFSASYPARADASGWTTTTQTVPFDFTLINGCTAQSDAVHLVGTINVLIHTRVQNHLMTD